MSDPNEGEEASRGGNGQLSRTVRSGYYSESLGVQKIMARIIRVSRALSNVRKGGLHKALHVPLAETLRVVW